MCKSYSFTLIVSLSPGRWSSWRTDWRWRMNRMRSSLTGSSQRWSLTGHYPKLTFSLKFTFTFTYIHFHSLSLTFTFTITHLHSHLLFSECAWLFSQRSLWQQQPLSCSQRLTLWSDNFHRWSHKSDKNRSRKKSLKQHQQQKKLQQQQKQQPWKRHQLLRFSRGSQVNKSRIITITCQTSRIGLNTALSNTCAWINIFLPYLWLIPCAPLTVRATSIIIERLAFTHKNMLTGVYIIFDEQVPYPANFNWETGTISYLALEPI